MTNKILKYKGYQGSIEVDVEKNSLWGKVLHVCSTITYAGKTPLELRSSFEQEVDEYLEDCAELGVEPEKPFSGVFQVRVPTDTHRAFGKLATEQGVSFNHIINSALERYLALEHSFLGAGKLSTSTSAFVSNYVKHIENNMKDLVRIKPIAQSLDKLSSHAYLSGIESQPKLVELIYTGSKTSTLQVHENATYRTGVMRGGDDEHAH